jgi:hypothetical protein
VVGLEERSEKVLSCEAPVPHGQDQAAHEPWVTEAVVLVVPVTKHAARHYLWQCTALCSARMARERTEQEQGEENGGGECARASSWEKQGYEDTGALLLSAEERWDLPGRSSCKLFS